MPAAVEALAPEQIEAFDHDGFVIVEEGLVPAAALETLRERFLRLFDGEYETGIKPDEVNWTPGRDPEDRTRQICNGWRADTVVAAQVLSERTGRLTAQLARYRGVRLLQDNVLWKPPGAKDILNHLHDARHPGAGKKTNRKPFVFRHPCVQPIGRTS